MELADASLPCHSILGDDESKDGVSSATKAPMLIPLASAHLRLRLWCTAKVGAIQQCEQDRLVDR